MKITHDFIFLAGYHLCSFFRNYFLGNRQSQRAEHLVKTRTEIITCQENVRKFYCKAKKSRVDMNFIFFPTL